MKRKRKKRRKERKRREKGLSARIRTRDLPALLKPSSLIKRDSKIFFRRMTAVSIVKPKVNAFHRIDM